MTEAQKAVNQALAKIRVLAENAIAGLKRFTILTHIFRNRKDGFADEVIAVAAGLWNFWLAQSYSGTMSNKSKSGIDL